MEEESSIRPGMLRWESTLSNGVVKTYSLFLAESRNPSRVSVDPAAYHFELSGNAKVLGGLLYYLSPTATRCIMSPMNGRLEIRRMEHAYEAGGGEDRSRGDAKNPSWNPNRKGKGRGAAATAFPSSTGFPNDETAEGDIVGSSGSAVVSAYPQVFNSFRYFDLAGNRSNEGKGGDSHTLNEPSRGEEPLFIPLPSKQVDTEPLRRAAYLAGQLSLPLQILLGGEGCPVHVRAPPLTAVDGVRSLPVASETLASDLSGGLQVSFEMYVAALDIAPLSRPSQPPPTPRSTVGEGVAPPLPAPSSQGMTTALSHPPREGEDRLSSGPSPVESRPRFHDPSGDPGRAGEYLKPDKDDPLAGDSRPPRPRDPSPPRGDFPLVMTPQAAREEDGERPLRRQRLSDLYPLDYKSFARARATAEEQGLDDRIGIFDMEEDEGLQRFLQNCASALSECGATERWSL
ncbi:unnamed protein product [Phytomonas sp. EM1]|nr:unnamed protein product [Phytomonas sp. EM1]|eukprot:CCW65294.1 unnamed protein product [Phytomonas sp. isolate EM1]